MSANCPRCGYTKEDSARWGDHNLCDGVIPGTKPRVKADPRMPNTVVSIGDSVVYNLAPPSSLEEEILSVPVDEAMRLKMEVGRLKYRNSPGEPFQGDPVAHLYSELIDALNYIAEIPKDDPRHPGDHVRVFIEAVVEVIYNKNRRHSTKPLGTGAEL